MAKERPFLPTNIPFWQKNDPDVTIPIYKLDNRAVCAEKAVPVSKPTPARILPQDLSHIGKTHTETMVSYQAHLPQPRFPHISRWTKLSTNFKMPISSHGDEAFVTSNSVFQPQRSEHQGLQQPRPKASPGGSSLQRPGRAEKLPLSTQQESYTPPSSSVDRPSALGPDPSIPTTKGDRCLHSYESHYKCMFDPKPLTQDQTVVKGRYVSAVSLGDKEKICERQTTHSASFPRPKVYSSPVLKQTPHFHLGHSSTQSWSCTSREAFCPHTAAEPVMHVRRNGNQSCVPKGDMDPQRVQERMSQTISSTSYATMKPVKRPETDAGLMTRSNVCFSPASLQSSYYSTTNTEHYSDRGQVERPRPAHHVPSGILSGPDQGPNLTVTQADFLPLPVNKAELSSSQYMTSIRFPVAAQLYTTTNNEAYTPKSTTNPPPAQSHFSSHILIQ